MNLVPSDQFSYAELAELFTRGYEGYFVPMHFDEPTLGLDVMAARTIVEFVRECRAGGKTVIYSTHIMSEADKLCNRIGIIHGGRLLAEGTPAALRAEHAPNGDLEDAFVRVVESHRTEPAPA